MALLIEVRWGGGEAGDTDLNTKFVQAWRIDGEYLFPCSWDHTYHSEFGMCSIYYYDALTSVPYSTIAFVGDFGSKVH